MFLDETTIYVKAGHGGAGGKHFLREKYKPFGGPAGGDGGAGGSVYLQADTGLNSLNDFRYKREFSAQDGQNGMRNKMAGRTADDIVISVPCGTVVRRAETKKIIVDLTTPGERFLLAKGGKGGQGNYHFASSRNQAPTYAQPGLPGEELRVELELKLIADAGLVGLPNAGKSTLLKMLTNAKPKIGDYPFTTLSPNLGILPLYKKNLVLADIPGLIEGASGGAGLGDEFLRHIERTKIIVHLVDASGLSGDPARNYRTIQRELKAYSAKLARKKQLVVFNKIDVPESAENIARFKQEFPQIETLSISAAARQNLDGLPEKLYKAIYG
ncbi:GTP-binding protein Obg [Candidatus Termititenax persephonae]|uniref:GTPase Obg n=1 Tax=Candidatus Termititenax persephonae TaxID=2218525 RepID=A0A388TL20_9BACT|nr:GTP-binding protein Obg [Candidatus Termititenax persephonae]